MKSKPLIADCGGKQGRWCAIQLLFYHIIKSSEHDKLCEAAWKEFIASNCNMKSHAVWLQLNYDRIKFNQWKWEIDRRVDQLEAQVKKQKSK